VIEVALGLIAREGRWFLQRRDPRSEVLPGLWEFPGGKVEPGEDPAMACRRELAEELGLMDPNLLPLEPITFDYGARVVRLHPFQVAAHRDFRAPLAWGWFTPGEILRLPIPAANASLVARLAAHAAE
jgi:mutator protein MutT